MDQIQLLYDKRIYNYKRQSRNHADIHLRVCMYALYLTPGVEELINQTLILVEFCKAPSLLKATSGIHNKTCFRTEAVVQTCSVKEVFLEISQNSQENTCASVSFLITFQA